MRQALLFLIGLLLGVCVATAPAAAAPSQASDHIAGAIALESKTVALVASREGEAKAYCSGVWVSSTSILTALHCVHGDTVIGYVVHEDVFPRGSKSVAGDIAPRFALTYAIDELHDLALLRAFGGAPSGHGVAHTRIGTVEQGMFAQGMGMPLGIWFSYASGDVSAVRVADLGDGNDTLYVQTTAPTSPGCSGGGLFDLYGDLIGIAHATAVRGQQVNFYVHKNHVEALLHAQGAAL